MRLPACLALLLTLPLGTAHADTATTIGALGQIAGAVYGTNAQAQTRVTGTTTLPVPIYSKDQMVAMSCLDLELAASRLDRAIAQSKATATDLYNQEKAASTAPSSQQQQQMRSIAAILGAVAQARGGKAAEYAGIATQIGGLNTSTLSQELDLELDRLQAMNEQAADMAIVRRHKNCGTTPASTTVIPAGTAVPVPVAAAGTAALAATAAATAAANTAKTSTVTTTVTTRPVTKAVVVKKPKKAKKVVKKKN